MTFLTVTDLRESDLAEFLSLVRRLVTLDTQPVGRRRYRKIGLPLWPYVESVIVVFELLDRPEARMRDHPWRTKRVTYPAVARIGKLGRRRATGCGLVAVTHKTSCVSLLRLHVFGVPQPLNLGVTVVAPRARPGPELPAVQPGPAHRSDLKSGRETLAMGLVRKSVFEFGCCARGKHAGSQRFVRARDASLFVAHSAETVLSRCRLEDFSGEVVALDA